MSSSPSATPGSSSSSPRRHSWDASNETEAMLEGSSSTSNVRLLPSPPTLGSSPLSSSSSSSSTVPGDHESFDDILAHARRPTSSLSKRSPLNPNSTPSRRNSAGYVSHRASFTHILRVPSEESRALSMHIPPSAASTRPSTPSSLSSKSPAFPPALGHGSPQRGSMILYRLASDELRSASESSDGTLLAPPRFRNSSLGGGGTGKRDSIASNSRMSISGDSIVSLSSDSKYPVGGSERGLVPYAYDPDEEGEDLLVYEDEEGEDWEFEDKHNEARWNEKLRVSQSNSDPGSSNATHSPEIPREQRKAPLTRQNLYYSSRGVVNATGLIILLFGLLALFIAYPVVSFYNDNTRNFNILNNPRINSTGQAEGDGGDIAAVGQQTPQTGVAAIVDRRYLQEEGSGYEVLDLEELLQSLNDQAGTLPRRSTFRFARHND
ncbi:hypothetical protein V5O48_000665 [Marasmius crinis-equi]|uniref:Uncharacterized protein n=1 Tax=Marasmius crinis-equi TaxID=585013 RepID=A0ABR3G1E9_9AGAR